MLTEQNVEEGKREIFLPCSSYFLPCGARSISETLLAFLCSIIHYVMEKLTNLGLIWEIINCTSLAPFLLLLLEESEFSSFPFSHIQYSFLSPGAEVCRGLVIPVHGRVSLSNLGRGPILGSLPGRTNELHPPNYDVSLIKMIFYFHLMISLFSRIVSSGPAYIDRGWGEFQGLAGKGSKISGVLSSGMGTPHGWDNEERDWSGIRPGLCGM